MINPQDTGHTATNAPPAVMTGIAFQSLALFGAVAAIFDGLHEGFDQYGQTHWAACNKRLHGNHDVYLDGVPVGKESDDRTGQPTTTASRLGRRACTQHVASYTAGQVLGTIAITRALGYRVPLTAIAVGAAINASTHWFLDRGPLLEKLAAWTDHTTYMNAVTVVRTPGGEAQKTGAGTAWNELDRSAHRAIGVVAAAVTTGLAMWLGGRK